MADGGPNNPSLPMGRVAMLTHHNNSPCLGKAGGECGQLDQLLTMSIRRADEKRA